jgi:hypothetical protein
MTEIERARAELHRLEGERALLLDRRDVAADERRRLAVAAASGDAEASARLGELRELAVQQDRRFQELDTAIESAHAKLEQAHELERKEHAT